MSMKIAGKTIKFTLLPPNGTGLDVRITIRQQGSETSVSHFTVKEASFIISNLLLAQQEILVA
jgi:hypothetical protein